MLRLDIDFLGGGKICHNLIGNISIQAGCRNLYIAKCSFSVK
jgi:hypothetical protein